MDIRKIIKEETDDFDWVRDVTPDVTDLFTPGNKYRMGLLHRHKDSNIVLIYDSYDGNYPITKDSDYAKSDGALMFKESKVNEPNYFYSKDFIKLRLQEVNLTFQDLEVDNE